MVVPGAASNRFLVLLTLAVGLAIGGCTSPREYLRNGFKVGPNAAVPGGPTAEHWIDAADRRLQGDAGDLHRWWTVFQDPVLDSLIACAANQNLSLREASYRVLETRAQLGIAQGNLFPQSQNAYGAYQRISASQAANDWPGTQFFDRWNFGFNLSWELDFWGRMRRAITAAEGTLEASAAQYDQVMVTLLGDVASNYVQIRTIQEQIKLVRSNVELQQRILNIADRRFKAGKKNELDSHQARSTLAETESQIPLLKIKLRQAGNRLCILLGMPPRDIETELSPGPIPSAPQAVVIGIPAELLRRRPDVRRAERQAASQAEQIGIAEAQLYPIFAINGTLGYQATNFPDLLTSSAFNSTIGPQFQWNILNYGRIRNNMRAQEAKFWSMVAVYQNTVLTANAEVEDGLVAFLRSQERSQLLDTSVASNQKAVDIVFKEYRVGSVDFNRVALIEQNLVQQQDLQARSHGDIAQGLIQVYRALGGGWQIAPQPRPAWPIAPLPPPPHPGEVIPSPPPEALNRLDQPSSTQPRWKMPMPEDAVRISRIPSAASHPD
jgi:NodT family efflux transporter outer membrane factor (OMF) lipoprotein